jgi:cell division protease FtsH
VQLLKDKGEELETLAQQLLDKEILFQHDLERLIGKRPFSKPTNYQEYTQESEPAEDEKKADDQSDQQISDQQTENGADQTSKPEETSVEEENNKN